MHLGDHYGGGQGAVVVGAGKQRKLRCLAFLPSRPGQPHGDPYTSALVAAFADAFSARGGKVPAQAEIEKGDTDMTEVLEQFAVAGPDAIFFPLFITEGSAFAVQARAFDGLEGTTLISAVALLVSAFLETPPSEGLYFAGPESDFRSNVNEVTGRSGKQVLAAFETRHGGFPGSPYWAHTYDATTILLSAIEAVAVEDGDRLHLEPGGTAQAGGGNRYERPGRDAILRPVRRLRHGADEHLPPHGQERHRRFQAAGGLRIQPLSR